MNANEKRPTMAATRDEAFYTVHGAESLYVLFRPENWPGEPLELGGSMEVEIAKAGTTEKLAAAQVENRVLESEKFDDNEIITNQDGIIEDLRAQLARSRARVEELENEIGSLRDQMRLQAMRDDILSELAKPSRLAAERAAKELAEKAANPEPPAPELYAVAKAYEDWEADLLQNGDWSGPTVRMTQEQHDRMIEIQTLRNAALAKAKEPTP